MDFSNWQMWVAVACAVLFALIKGGPLATKLAKGVNLSSLTGDAKPTRMQALEHLDAAFNYFDAIACKEGMDAIKAAGQHAFEHREATP